MALIDDSRQAGTVIVETENGFVTLDQVAMDAATTTARQVLGHYWAKEDCASVVAAYVSALGTASLKVRL